MSGRGDRERDAARTELAKAEVERLRAEERDVNELLHRRVERTHRRVAETHERAAQFFDAHDEPDVTADEATAIADDMAQHLPGPTDD